MSPVCAIVRSSFEGYASDALAAPQRRMLRDHLESCRDCRDAAAAADPTLLFARPIRDEMAEKDREAILASVRTGVDLMQAERRIAGRPRRRLIGPAAAAAVTALLFWTPGWRAPRSAAPTLGEAVVADASSRKPMPADPLPEVTATAGLRPAGLAGDVAPPTSDATIYDWNPGAGREEPRVVWIVDGGLDI